MHSFISIIHCGNGVASYQIHPEPNRWYTAHLLRVGTGGQKAWPSRLSIGPGVCTTSNCHPVLQKLRQAIKTAEAIDAGTC